MTEVYKVKRAQNFNIEVDIPGSKSVTNRALILAALAEGEVVLKNVLFSDDTEYMVAALQKLGNEVEVDRASKVIKVKGNQERDFGTQELFVGNAGTAMRFLASYVSLGKGDVTLTGIERMKNRPIKDLVEVLRTLGVEIEYLEKDGYPPILIKANGMRGGKVIIDASKSSQYLSSVLLSAPYAKNEIEISIEKGLVSVPYVKITETMMNDFGVDIENIENKIFRIKEGRYKRPEYIVEGDCSSASYFFAAAAIGKGQVRLNNVKLDCMQGDIELVKILEKMGLDIIEAAENHITVKCDKELTGITVDMHHISDVAQTLSVVALFAKGKTEIKNVYNMRIKETDRISAVCNEIKKIGGEVEEYEDGLTIIPKNLEDYNTDVDIETYDDHRMAMSFTLAGLRIEGINILDPGCVSKTFPNFYDEFEKIYK